MLEYCCSRNLLLGILVFINCCSELITANRLLCMHLLRYCKVFRKSIFTRYISLAAGSACSALPLAAQRLSTAMTTVM